MEKTGPKVKHFVFLQHFVDVLLFYHVTYMLFGSYAMPKTVSCDKHDSRGVYIILHLINGFVLVLVTNNSRHIYTEGPTIREQFVATYVLACCFCFCPTAQRGLQEEMVHDG